MKVEAQAEARTMPQDSQEPTRSSEAENCARHGCQGLHNLQLILEALLLRTTIP